jgi:protease PrsW
VVFAAAFLWGGCIATALALPFNTAFFLFVDTIVAQEPAIREMLGPDAAMLLAAPISAPIAEEIAKALGVLLLFWLLRAEFDNMRDGIVYGAVVGLAFNWFEAALQRSLLPAIARTHPVSPLEVKLERERCEGPRHCSE